jgi:hypothetical protein
MLGEDPRPPDMFSRAHPIRYDRLQDGAILGGHCHGDTIRHAADSHASVATEILNRTHALDLIH